MYVSIIYTSKHIYNLFCRAYDDTNISTSQCLRLIMSLTCVMVIYSFNCTELSLKKLQLFLQLKTVIIDCFLILAFTLNAEFQFGPESSMLNLGLTQTKVMTSFFTVIASNMGVVKKEVDYIAMNKNS